uniref:Uncharacterized protein n=1 Tax=Octopus bimaculoides TaxID=37653 RepID=A0A0L8GXF3_OCTBM
MLNNKSSTKTETAGQVEGFFFIYFDHSNSIGIKFYHCLIDWPLLILQIITLATLI